MRARILYRLFVALVLLGTAACGAEDPSGRNLHGSDGADVGVDAEDGEDAAITYPDVEYPRQASAVETTVLASTVTAGQSVQISCEVLDADGLPLALDPAPEFYVVAAPSGAFERQGDDLVAVRAGEGMVHCTVPELGLADETPETITIEPGAAYRSAIEVDRTQMVAGETLNATCRIYDAYGNFLPDTEPELAVAPGGQGVQLAGLSATIEAADVYSVSCFLPGLSEEQHVHVEVVPDKPASLVLGRMPNQMVYGIGQVVTVTWIVSDQYGNRIEDAVVTAESAPGGEDFGHGRYRYHAEGVYTVTVEVQGPTHDGMPLVDSTTFVVNSNGPAIGCDDPLDGSMLHATPGATVTFTGSVADANGVQSVLVNGAGVPVAADGTFEATHTVNYGINFIDIAAVDQYGEENSRTCAFLAADQWGSESGFLWDAVSLKLRQQAVDDNNPYNGLNSLNDLLRRVVNSSGLVSELDAALRAANPLKPMSCDSESCGFWGCVCWYSSRVRYLDMRIDGPNHTSLELVTDGVRAVATIRNIAVKVRVDGKAAGISYDTTGWVNTEYVKIDLTLNLGLTNGQPSASVRQVNSVEVGSVSTDFDGLDGFFINIIIALFENDVRELIANQIRDYIRDNFDQVLDGLFAGLDIASLGTSFDVPRLDASGAVNVTFTPSFSRMNVSSSRLVVGLGTRLRSVPQHGRPSLGVALPPGPVWNDPTIWRAVGVGVHVGVLNQALHALWRGGWLDATLTGADLGQNTPPDAEAVVQADLPPVVQNLGGGAVKLMLGTIHVDLTYPGVFDEPLSVTLGAVATTSVEVVGEELQFSNLVIDQLYFTAHDVSLDATTRSILEGFLQRLVQALVDASLNQSLPALPIPAFEIPQSLGQYGLPVGRELGLLSPELVDTPSHYVLMGQFGLR